MKQHTIDAIELAFKNLLLNEEQNSEGYCILVQTIDDWEYELPAELIKTSLMKINIKDWTREESYTDNNGIYVKTAFGEDENSKFFPFNEIIGLYNFEDEQLFIKPYVHNMKKSVPQPIPEPVDKHSMKSIMHPDIEGLKHSRSKLTLLRKEIKPKIKEKKDKLLKKKKNKKKPKDK